MGVGRTLRLTPVGGMIFRSRNHMKLLATFFFTILVSSPLTAQQSQSCKSNPYLVGQCFKLHGRASVVNGPGLIIWRIGTGRILGVQGEEENIPDTLSEALHKGGDVYRTDVFGDFEVCPLTKSKPGEMQWVCVESASHLVIRENTH